MGLGLRSGFPIVILFAAMALAGCKVYGVKVAQVERKTPVVIADTDSLAPMKLERIGVKLRRGTPIGEFEFNILSFRCIPNRTIVFWNQGRVRGSDIEFIDIFYEEMTNANFNVVGNPNKLFEDLAVDTITPRFVMGGQIEEIKMELCERLTGFGQD